MEAVSIVMGLYPIVGRFLVCVNCAGDAAVTYIVAKGEKKVQIGYKHGGYQYGINEAEQ